MDTKNNKTKILIVDDDCLLREFITYALEEEGFDIESAADGIEGLKKIASNRPDIIILDVTMPRMNGLEVYKYLKNNPETRDIFVIFLSAQKNIDKTIPAYPGVITKYIEKPCDLEYLIAQINSLIITP